MASVNTTECRRIAVNDWSTAEAVAREGQKRKRTLFWIDADVNEVRALDYHLILHLVAKISAVDCYR